MKKKKIPTFKNLSLYIYIKKFNNLFFKLTARNVSIWDFSQSDEFLLIAIIVE